MGKKAKVKAFRGEVDALRNVIRKTVNEVLSENAKKISQEEGSVSEFGKLNNKILMLRREIEMLRSELESSKTKRLEEELERNIGNLKSQVSKAVVDNKGLEERLGSEIEGIRNEINSRKPGRQPSGLNMEGLLRDIEIIKTKQEWIENNIERIDIKPLLRKMEELEHRIRLIRTSTPVVVE